MKSAAIAISITATIAVSQLIASPAQSAVRLERVPDDPARPVTLVLPLNGTIGLVSSLWQIRETTGAQFGVELLPETPQSREGLRVPRRPQARVSLVGMTVDEAVSTVIREAPEYTWTRRGAIVNVEPIVPFPTPSFLDRRIPQFAFENRTMLEARWLFERRFDENARLMSGMILGGLSAPGDDDAARIKALAEAAARRFSVNMRNLSAREVLNAICASHGSLSWQVAYTDEARDYAHARIALVADGARVQP